MASATRIGDLALTSDHRLVGSNLLDDPRLRRGLDLLNPDGEETRIVGGAVRNALLGLLPGDIDLATTMLPAAVQSLAKAARIRAIPTGIEHGTVTLVVQGLTLEVTTLRQDVETDGRHAVVRFGRDFSADAERRDFTINALSLMRDGSVRDTVGGIADLSAGRVRFIGDAATRVREDYLRILRFFRFHASYGRGALDPLALEAATEERDGISRLSRERIRSETVKLLVARDPQGPVRAMSEAGILTIVLGAKPDVGAFEAVAALEQGAPGPVIRLAALSIRSTADVLRLRDRLRLTNAETARLTAMLEAWSGFDSLPDGTSRRRLLFDHGRIAVVDALRLGYAAAPEPRRVEDWSAAVHEVETAALPSLPWSGSDLLERGLRGPRVGLALADLRRTWAEAGFPDDATALRQLLDRVVDAPDRTAE